MSSTYRLSSESIARNEAVDPAILGDVLAQVIGRHVHQHYPVERAAAHMRAGAVRGLAEKFIDQRVDG